MLRPRSEEPQLAIISVIGKPHLGPDEQYLLVMYDDATVVDHVLVRYGPIEIPSV